jgi:hypothetical protein
MEKPQSHPTRHIFFAALEYHVEFTSDFFDRRASSLTALKTVRGYLLRYVLL